MKERSPSGLLRRIAGSRSRTGRRAGRRPVPARSGRSARPRCGGPGGCPDDRHLQSEGFPCSDAGSVRYRSAAPGRFRPRYDRPCSWHSHASDLGAGGGSQEPAAIDWGSARHAPGAGGTGRSTIFALDPGSGNALSEGNLSTTIAAAYSAARAAGISSGCSTDARTEIEQSETLKNQRRGRDSNPWYP